MMIFRNKNFQLTDSFYSEMDKFMKSRGYCCGNHRILFAKAIPCSGANNCFVNSNEGYYRYDQWTFCLRCFAKFKTNEIKLENEE